MEAVGVNTGFLLLQCIPLLLWGILAVLALLNLRRRPLSEGVRVAWAVLIVVVPILGAIALYLVDPGTIEGKG
ncbi:MAG TPA: PLD nuclease N-terminal domain-containing protein [Anaerolineae bacterium]